MINVDDNTQDGKAVHIGGQCKLRERRVRIPARDDHDGRHAVAVTVAWICPRCGGPRGTVAPTISFDGSQRLGCDGWKNPAAMSTSTATFAPRQVTADGTQQGRTHPKEADTVQTHPSTDGFPGIVEVIGRDDRDQALAAAFKAGSASIRCWYGRRDLWRRMCRLAGRPDLVERGAAAIPLDQFDQLAELVAENRSDWDRRTRRPIRRLAAVHTEHGDVRFIWRDDQ